MTLPLYAFFLILHFVDFVIQSKNNSFISIMYQYIYIYIYDNLKDEPQFFFHIKETIFLFSLSSLISLIRS